MSPVKLIPRERERFAELVSDLKRADRALAGGPQGGSVFDRTELHPGFLELQKHLGHALRWAEEMQWIIETELSPA